MRALGGEAGQTAVMADHYVDGTCSWWHLSFGAWRVEDMERAEVPSDTRMLEVIVARLSAGRVR